MCFIRIEHSSMLGKGKASLHSKTLGEYSSRDHVIDDRTTHSVVRTQRQSSTGGGGPQLNQMSKNHQKLDSEKFVKLTYHMYKWSTKSAASLSEGCISLYIYHRRAIIRRDLYIFTVVLRCS